MHGTPRVALEVVDVRCSAGRSFAAGSASKIAEDVGVRVGDVGKANVCLGRSRCGQIGLLETEIQLLVDGI